MRMITVLVVNDQNLERLGLRLLIEAQPDIDIAGEAADSAEAVRAAARLHPDVVLMDMGTPSATALSAIRHIARPDSDASSTGSRQADGAPARVLVLAGPDLEEHADAVLGAGAHGLLNRDALPEQLTAAIRNVARGGAALSPRVMSRLIDAVRAQPADRPERGLRLPSLTERENEVLIALASGLSNTEIAERLSIAPTTVKTHVASILAKIAVRTRAQAVAYAYNRGLIRAPLP